jgi:hypothetical protein
MSHRNSKKKGTASDNSTPSIGLNRARDTPVISGLLLSVSDIANETVGVLPHGNWQSYQ